MKKALILAAILLLAVGSAAMAGSYILPINHLDGGGWTEYAGAGYGGASAWGANTMDGVRRVYWSLGDVSVPVGTNLYTIEFYGPTAGGTNWQPIESQFKGVDGETYPMEPLIPWDGAYGTNHEYVGSDGANDGMWHSTGPGPHTPETPAMDAGPNGTLMWLKETSWLYAKWDYGWAIDRSWSALRITLVPEPSSFLALLAGIPALALLRRKR